MRGDEVGGRGAEPVGRRGLAGGAGVDGLQAAQLIGDGQERRRAGAAACGARAARDCDGAAVHATAVTAAAVSAPATMRVTVVDRLQ